MKSVEGSWGEMNYKRDLYKFQISPKNNTYQRRMLFLPSGKKIFHIVLPFIEALGTCAASLRFPEFLCWPFRSCFAMTAWTIRRESLIDLRTALAWKDRSRSGFFYWHFGPDHSLLGVRGVVLWSEGRSASSLVSVAHVKSWHQHMWIHDIHRCLQTLSHTPWVAKLSSIENTGLDWY